MTTTSWRFATLHYLFTLVLAPFVSGILELFVNLSKNELFNLLEVFPLVWVFGLLFSLPVALLYFLAVYFLRKQLVAVIKAKWLLTLLTLLLMTGTLAYLNCLSVMIVLPYTITIVLVAVVLPGGD